VIVPDAGHSALEPGIRAALVNATENFRLSMADEQLFAPRFPWENGVNIHVDHPAVRSAAGADRCRPPGTDRKSPGAATGCCPSRRPRSPRSRPPPRRWRRARPISPPSPAKDFHLPTLAPKLKARVDGEVLNGRGFILLRGLPVKRWTMREAATVFFGLGAHLGSARSQNGKGHVLGHVQDLGLASNDPNVRIYQTHERQTFHTDSCDIVGLLCLKTARSGGLSALVSSTTIFNEMRRQRPIC